MRRLRPQRKVRIAMVSVGRDGQLWVMSGPADGKTRTTLEGGKTWTLGNHQVFERRGERG